MNVIVRNQKFRRVSSVISGEIIRGLRSYGTKWNSGLDFKKIRPMILNRIEERANQYPVKGMIGVAQEVLGARIALHDGVSALIQHIPVWACKYCPEVHIGDSGHLIQTCPGYRHHAKNKVHNWVRGGINDVIVQVEAFHLQKMFQKVIEHHERFDHDRVPAVVELCLQAGASFSDQELSSSTTSLSHPGNNMMQPESVSDDELRLISKRTLNAWETLRSGVQKLLLVYPARVCKHCSEVHVGPSGHKARMCGVFKYENWHGTHFWGKAKVDDLVPPKIVWFRRRQDPPILLDKGREFYGHAPAVIDLCNKGGATVPSKYSSMMKMDGLTAPI